MDVNKSYISKLYPLYIFRKYQRLKTCTGLIIAQSALLGQLPIYLP